MKCLKSYQLKLYWSFKETTLVFVVRGRATLDLSLRFFKNFEDKIDNHNLAQKKKRKKKAFNGNIPYSYEFMEMFLLEKKIPFP